MSIFDQNKMLP